MCDREDVAGGLMCCERLVPWSERVARYFDRAKQVQVTDGEELSCGGDLVDGVDGNNAVETLGDYAETEAHCPGIVHANDNNTFHGFLSLPFDIRNMIYTLLLVRGSIFISGHNLDNPNANTDPHNSSSTIQNNKVFSRALGLIRTRCLAFDQSFEMKYNAKSNGWKYVARNPLTMGLVQGVSRLIQEEAEAVLWGIGNEFVLPVQKLGRPRELWDGGVAGNVGVLRKIKRVNLALDFRDLGKVGLKQGRHLITNPDFVKTGNFSSEMDAQRAIHRDLVVRICQFWRTRLNALTQVSSLHSLKLDVDECFCPLRCCRLVKTIFKSRPIRFAKVAASEGVESSDPPRSVEIFGVADDEERALALRYFETRGVARPAVSFETAFVDYSAKDDDFDMFGHDL